MIKKCADGRENVRNEKSLAHCLQGYRVWAFARAGQSGGQTGVIHCHTHTFFMGKIFHSQDAFSSRIPRRALLESSSLTARASAKCGCGEIGRRTRFRFWRREAWGFKSLHPHHFFKKSKRSIAGQCSDLARPLLAVPSRSCREISLRGWQNGCV